MLPTLQITNDNNSQMHMKNDNKMDLTNFQNKKIQSNMWFQQYMTCKTKQHWPLKKPCTWQKKFEGQRLQHMNHIIYKRFQTKYIWFQNKTNQIDKGPCNS